MPISQTKLLDALQNILDDTGPGAIGNLEPGETKLVYHIIWLVRGGELDEDAAAPAAGGAHSLPAPEPPAAGVVPPEPGGE